MNVLVTGGAGFIGSHLCKRLINDGFRVVAVDNLSNGRLENLENLQDSVRFSLQEFDVNNRSRLRTLFEKYSFDIVFHLAANADVSKGEESPDLDLENTFQTTISVLEVMREYQVKKFFFSSSSTVYGNVESRIQESHAIMRPISHYGAAKLASEAFVSSYCSLYGIQVWVARFCNAVGPKMTHGVIPDLIRKLRSEFNSLTVYGDGNQTKPYIYIDDLIDGVIYMIEKAKADYNVYLVGVESVLTVSKIVEIVMEETGIKKPVLFSGKYCGWKGDVRKYQYDVTSLRMLGWSPRFTANEAVRLAVKQNLP